MKILGWILIVFPAVAGVIFSFAAGIPEIAFIAIFFSYALWGWVPFLAGVLVLIIKTMLPSNSVAAPVSEPEANSQS